MKFFTTQAEIDAQAAALTEVARERDEARTLLAKLRADLDAKLPDRDVKLRDAAATVHAMDVAYATLSQDRDHWRKKAENLDLALVDAEKEIDSLKDGFLDSMKILNEEKAAALAESAKALAASEERLRTSQALHDAEAARHAETRTERDTHAQDAIDVGRELDQAKQTIVELRARAERAEQGERAARAQSDAEINAVRNMTKKGA